MAKGIERKYTHYTGGQVKKQYCHKVQGEIVQRGCTVWEGWEGVDCVGGASATYARINFVSITFV